MEAREITAAALRCLDVVGVDALTMRVVAAEMKIRVTSLYHVVPDRSALLSMLVEHFADQIVDAWRVCDPTLSDPIEGAGVVASFLLQHRDAAQVLTFSPLSASDSAVEVVSRLIDALEPMVTPYYAPVCARSMLSFVSGHVQQVQLYAQTTTPELRRHLHAMDARVFDRAADWLPESLRAIVVGFAAMAANEPRALEGGHRPASLESLIQAGAKACAPALRHEAPAPRG